MMSIHEELTALIWGGGDAGKKAEAIMERFFVSMPLTPEQHKAYHIKLHRNFDELLADFLMHNKRKVPSSTTLREFMEWSGQQTEHPTEFK